MADNLVKLMDETGYRQLINMLISIKSSQQENVEKCISVWQPSTMYQKDKVVLVINDNTYSEYVCKATHESGETFNETYWTLVSCTDFEGYTEEELLAMLNLTEEELDSLQNLINNDEIQTDHVWSSSKVYAELLTVLSESKNFTIAEVAKIVSFSYKVVTSEDDVIDDKAIYLIENATTSTYDMYLLVDNSPSKVGNTNINLEGYVKKEDIIDTFDETTIYTDSDKVFSTKASKSMYDDLNDKKISKSNIVTTLDDTVTNEQVVGALAVKEELDERNIKIYTSLNQLGLASGCMTGEIFVAMSNNSQCIIPCSSFSVADVPVSNGILIIDKSTNMGFSILFKKSSGSLVDSNAMWIGQLMGNDGTGLTWSKVCMTKVKDVSKTNISSKLINATINSGGGVYYSVKNGICNVQIAGLVASTSGAVIFPKGSLPKVDINNTNGHYPVVSPNATCGLLVFDGVGAVRYYGNSMTIYATISYAVADDWRP